MSISNVSVFKKHSIKLRGEVDELEKEKQSISKKLYQSEFLYLELTYKKSLLNEIMELFRNLNGDLDFARYQLKKNKKEYEHLRYKQSFLCKVLNKLKCKKIDDFYEDYEPDASEVLNLCKENEVKIGKAEKSILENEKNICILYRDIKIIEKENGIKNVYSSKTAEEIDLKFLLEKSIKNKNPPKKSLLRRVFTIFYYFFHKENTTYKEIEEKNKLSEKNYSKSNFKLESQKNSSEGEITRLKKINEEIINKKMTIIRNETGLKNYFSGSFQ